jgi:hypothetical protein
LLFLRTLKKYRLKYGQKKIKTAYLCISIFKIIQKEIALCLKNQSLWVIAQIMQNCSLFDKLSSYLEK